MSTFNLKDNLIRILFRSFKKQEIKIHELNYLFWECTLRCTLNCLHCGSDCRSEATVPDMPAEDFLRTLRDISNHVEPSKTTIVITGGEPTLRKDLADTGREIRKIGFHWGIVTNGMLYTEELHQNLMNSGMGAITVSMDGLKNNHNWLRNSPKSFGKAVNAIDLIRQESRLNYDIVSCINQRNIDELPEMLNFMEERKIKAWRIFTIAPIGRAKENDEMLLKPDQLKRLMNFIEEKRKISSTDIKFSCEAYTGPYENKIRDGFFFCRAGVNIGSILVDGSISACPNIDRGFIQGNIYKDSFMDVWNDKFSIMRNRSWAKDSSCKNCKEFKSCNGGAMHLWTAYSPELLQCHYNDIKQTISKEPH